MNIKVLAHRGGQGRAPENTLEAFRQAKEDGADGIECDVRLTRDGEPVLFHDRDGRRLTGDPRRLRAMDWKELRGLRVLGRCRVPHLEEALQAMAGWEGAELTIDLHEEEADLVEAVVRRLSVSSLRERCSLLAFFKEAWMLHFARALDPAVRLSVMPGMPWYLEASAEELRPQSVCLGWDSAFNRFLYKACCRVYDLRPGIARMKKRGIPVSAGIANRPEDVRYLLAQGADAVWTDDIPMAREALFTPWQ